MSKFAYSQGSLCGAFTTISSGFATINETEWFTVSRGTLPETFQFYSTGLVDAKPVKKVYVQSTLGTNIWN